MSSRSNSSVVASFTPVASRLMPLRPCEGFGADFERLDADGFFMFSRNRPGAARFRRSLHSAPSVLVVRLFLRVGGLRLLWTAAGNEGRKVEIAVLDQRRAGCFGALSLCRVARLQGRHRRAGAAAVGTSKDRD